MLKLAGASGAEMWRLTWSGTGEFSDQEFADTVVVDADDTVVVAGTVTNSGTSGDMAVVKLSGDGGDLACFARIGGAAGDPCCTGQKVPGAIRSGFRRAGRLVKRAARAKAARKRQALFRQATRALRPVPPLIDHAAARKHRPLSATCTTALRIQVRGAKRRVEGAIG